MKMDHAHGGALADCLAIICNYHNRPFSGEALIAGLPLVDDKLTPSVLSRAAKRAGFKSKLVHRDLDAVNTALLPAIVLMANNQACVLLSFDKHNEQVSVIYPELADTPVQQSTGEFEKAYSGAVIYLQPEFAYDARAPLTNKNSRAGWFWPIIKECRSLYRDVIIAALFIGLFSVTMPLFVMNVYDRVVPNQAVHTLWVLGIGAMLALSADLVLRLMRSYSLELAASRIDVKVSATIMERVLGMQLKNKPQSSGSFAANLHAFESIRGFFSSMTLVALVDLPFVLIYVLIIALIGLELIVPLIIGAIVILLYALASHNRLEQLSDNTMKVSAMRNAVLVESLNNLDDIKAFHGECKVQSAWERATLYLARINAQSRLLSASITNLSTWMQQGVGIGLIIVGVYLVIDGELTQGGLIAAYLLSSRAMAPISQTAAVMAQYHHAATAMDSLNEIMDKPVERPEGKHWVSHPVLNGHLKLDQVNFSYDGNAVPIIRNVSLQINVGEHVALVGKNGSGKSTIEKLFMGLYSPNAGHILVDDIDIGQLDPAELRHNIGYVPQDVSLMYGTLRDNITLGAWHAEDEQIIAAAEKAGLMELINAHPDGLDLQVGEQGKLLSGGQRQAVALARALINDPPVLLLDEPSAALDHSSEQRLIHTLKHYCSSKTLVLVTHRSALLDLVDRVIVMDKGQIIADGDKATITSHLTKKSVKHAS
mgnify:CR=1 FL=1|tara:strand:- start:1630 stop:3762 length:2133 start_codon:yes stop_codon:yes gene_type:complete